VDTQGTPPQIAEAILICVKDRLVERKC
jgi:hypothetical protein